MASINEKEIRLAVFDMDGTILDSEKIHYEKWMETAKILGYEMTTAQWYGLLGTNEESEKQYLLNLYGKDCPAAEFRTVRMKLINEYAEKYGMPQKSGFRELSAFLHENGIKSVVATSSVRTRAEKLLKKVGIYECFDGLTCGDEVSNGKPDPELFLKAAQKANIEPQNCIVLEDSANGIEAANRAGMTAVCIPDMQPATDKVRQTAIVVSSLEKLIKYFSV